jgi:hypothetical protein
VLLNSVEPKTSKITGGVTIDLYGNDFIENQFLSYLQAAEYTDTSSSNGTVGVLTQGISLTLPEEVNQRASVDLNKIMGESFELRLSFTRDVRSFPLIDRMKALGIECIDQTSILNRTRVFVEYREGRGYLLVVEAWESSSIVSREEMPFDPKNIEELIVKACGRYIHGYVKVSGQDLFFGKTSILSGTSYSVRLFSETPESGVALESRIDLQKVELKPLVSFAGYPTELVSVQDERVRARTLPGHISFGDIIFSGGSGTVVKIENEVRYVIGSGVSTVSKRFDTVQAIYNEYVNPSREKLFSDNEGFSWDEGFLLGEAEKNNNLFVPSLWDPSTGNIPQDFFQSGVGAEDSLKYVGIKKTIAQDQEKWFAKINHGTYFVANVPYYLFSDESIIEFLSQNKTTDGRSIHPLLYKPKIGIPIIASSLTEEPESKRIVEDLRLQKRGKFTGKVLNGVELDSSFDQNIDRTKEEFIVIYNADNEIKNWRVPILNVEEGRYVFELPKIPLTEFNLRFSRQDIFKEQKTIAKTYGEDTYDSFLFGEGIIEYGDYAIDYKRGVVEVLLERAYTDLGFLSYTYDYPAVIEFNNDYTSDIGSDITDPTFRDLRTLDNIGMSAALPAQKFRLTSFPVIDTSSVTIVDRTNFKLFVYDEFDNSFDTSWVRVLSFDDYGPTDKVYKVNSSEGIVSFGDGVKGIIPVKYMRILAGYKPTLKIQFEPESSSDLWSGKTIDLNLSKQTLNSGFLYISRKDLIPAQMELEFAAKSINAFETTDLNATVFTQEGEVVPGVNIFFEIVAGGGDLKDINLFSNPNGQADTIYTPSSRLEDIGIKIDLYEESQDEEIKGVPSPQSFGDENGVPYLSLKANELIQGDTEEIYLFKILDDGDDFLPYNNITRRGGRLVLLHDGVAPIRGTFLAGSIIGFNGQLPQPFDMNAPNYEPDLRGFYIVGKKTIQARAYVDLEEIRVYSDIVSITVEYSPLQKGVWTLPTPPVEYDSSQINTATYINI